MRVLRVLWEFGVDFVIGDDPKIAIAVVLSLALAAVLLVTGVLSGPAVTVVGAAAVVVTFTVSLVVDIRGGIR